ncbi:MAG: hypothetical protein IH819_12875 [Bacteroidetes bacterium]|nr:hypothetical protein [Bacteroidota bacterium]
MNEVVLKVNARSLRGDYDEAIFQIQNKFEITSPDFRRDRDDSTSFDTTS